MVKRVVREAWLTFDSREFASREDAEKHERVTKLTLELDKSSIDWRDADPADVAEFIDSRYILTPRETDRGEG